MVAAGLSIDDLDTNIRVLKLSFELDFIKYWRLELFMDWFTDDDGDHRVLRCKKEA